MVPKALNKALYFELTGQKEEALKTYAAILKKEPSHTEAKSAIRRLSGIRAKFAFVNQERLQQFIHIKNNEDVEEFEQWLLKINR